MEPVQVVPVQADRVKRVRRLPGRQRGRALATVVLGYCDAEVLHWQYGRSDGTLSLSDERILLNCCGDHAMSVSSRTASTSSPRPTIRSRAACAATACASSTTR